MNIFITGGAGYVGSRLVPQLLDEGHNVTVFDTFWFGNFLPEHRNLRRILGDIRDDKFLHDACMGHEIFINLACVSNDASFELNEELSTSINLDAFEPMVIAAKKAGIKRFIYASSSSVYGVSEVNDVTENHPLVPLTYYNKYKALCELLLLKHTDDNFTGVIFRPATVCGYSPRMRLDLSVNILTHLAMVKNQITVFGGSQQRPNLHIQDYCDVVKLLMVAPKEKVANQVFNVGRENSTIMNLAQLVKMRVEEMYPEKKIEIITTPSDDLRSYHINSEKILHALGFVPKLSVSDAIREVAKALVDGKIPNSLDDDSYYNVKRLKRMNVA